MASFGDDSTLMKIAVFGLTMSIIATACIAVLIAPSNEYSYDQINGYRNSLADFSGKSMINDTPWVLTKVYTPWNSSYPVQGHMDDRGWLYGQDVTWYDQIGKVSDIHLSPNHKSSKMLSTGSQPYSYVAGKEWWAGGNRWGIKVINPDWISALGGSDGNIYESGIANVWNYTGYRYVFDPVLPFSDDNTASSIDGALSIVWYYYEDGQEGLSGGLDVYGREGVILSSYSATDIINGYESVGGYAKVYNFVFDGITLQLSILFSPDAIAQGQSLWDAWTTGNWTMAISSKSAGNFYDVKNSNSFLNTTGSMLQTFTDIYTFNTPSIDNPWMDLILWLLVGLPMTVAMLCVTLRIVQTFVPW